MDDTAFFALMQQALDGEAEAVLAALDLDPSLATRDGYFGRTLLHWACMGKHLELGRALLDRGSDVHARDDDGQDALSMPVVAKATSPSSRCCSTEAPTLARRKMGASPRS